MNHKTRVAIGTALAVAMTGLVVSCGGGGSGFVGIDRLGVSSGAITGFGSVFVNGVEWDTSGATITVDDNPGTESALKVGQVVTVRGTLSEDGTQGDADSVEFDNSVEGPIAAGSIDLNTNSFIVLGQTVILSADTEFDDSIPAGVDGEQTLADLNDGDVVEVSGYRDSAGAVRATRIEIRGALGDVEVKGTASVLNPGPMTFQIGSLVVDYSLATLDFGSDTLSDGDFVEAEGTLVGGVLVADRVQLEDSPSGDDSGDEGEVEGYVTRFVSATDFDVAGVPVTTDAGTDFEGGIAADLALNVKVEVEGEVNASGVVVANKIEFRVQPDDATVEITGDVDTVDPVAGTVTINGMDVVISVNAATRFEDESDADLETFSLADLSPGDHVEIRGAEDPTVAANDAIATRVKRQDADIGVELRGPIQAINEPDLTILGVQVVTDFAGFSDEDGNSIDDVTFFATVVVGDVIKATTTSVDVTGNVFEADEIEIEEIDD